MIKSIIEILNYSDYYGFSERIDIAKGKFEVPITLKKIKNTIKRHSKWPRQFK
jgi:hypothetical protein